MIDQYIVDAFTDKLFAGNPAAVCIMEDYPEDALMLAVAKENNLSETAFVKPLGQPGRYHLRWFTPAAEIDLCGHATLASAFVVLTQLEPGLDSVSFDVLGKDEIVAYQASPPRSGVLHCRRDDDRIVLGGAAVLFEKGQLQL